MSLLILLLTGTGGAILMAVAAVLDKRFNDGGLFTLLLSLAEKKVAESELPTLLPPAAVLQADVKPCEECGIVHLPDLKPPVK
jgi:hypothetical protein